MNAQTFLEDAFWEGSFNESFGAVDFDQLPAEIKQSLASLGGVVLFASSGSSGRQKYIVHTRETLLASARSVNTFLEVSEKDVFGLALPPHHVGGFGILSRAYLSGNYGEIFPSKWEAGEFANWVREKQVTITSLVPTQVFDLVQKNLKAPESLRVIVVGGGTLDAHVGKQARGLGWNVLQSYGMTESASQIATSSLANLEQEFSNERLELLPNWRCRLAETGRLLISGFALAKGILHFENKQWRYEAIHQEFETSDHVLLGDGFLTFSGRADRIIKIKGELLDLERYERELSETLQTTCVLLALEDRRAGRILKCVSEQELDKVKINNLMPKFAQVSSFSIVSKFHRSALGKLDRTSLEKLF